MSENQIPDDAVPIASTVAVGKQDPVAGQKVRSLEFELPNLKKVVMAARNISLTAHINSTLEEFKGDVQARELEKKRVRSLLYIKSIDGVEQPIVQNAIMRAAMEQQLGEENLDAILMLCNEHFPETDAKALRITRNF